MCRSDCPYRTSATVVASNLLGNKRDTSQKDGMLIAPLLPATRKRRGNSAARHGIYWIGAAVEKTLLRGKEGRIKRATRFSAVVGGRRPTHGGGAEVKLLSLLFR